MNSVLVEAETQDGLILHGLYSGHTNEQVVVVHVHGFEGNFYENKFVGFVGSKLANNNVGFLTGNNRGAEKVKLFRSKDGEYVTLGAKYERLEESSWDIDGWIETIDRLTKNKVQIVLQGHSLGTMKVIRYLGEGKYKDRVKGLILLAPFDKNAFLRKVVHLSVDELLRLAKKQVEEGRGQGWFNLAPKEERMSAITFISWYAQDDLGRMFDFGNQGYDFPVLAGIKVPTLIAVSRDDEFFHSSNPEQPQEAMAIFEKYIKQVKTKLFKEGGHGFANYEEELGELIYSFVSEL